MNILDHVVTSNINISKYQLNDSIENEPKFDTNSFNSSSETRDPLPVVIVTLRGGKKHRETDVSGITRLRDTGATNSIIK